MWPKSVKGIQCIHCGRIISHRPIPVVVSKTMESVYSVEALAHSFACAKSYMKDMGLTLEGLCTSYMNDVFRQFKANADEYDDTDHVLFIRGYDSFMSIPDAPPRKAFVRFGTGYLTDDKADAIFAELISKHNREEAIARIHAIKR